MQKSKNIKFNINIEEVININLLDDWFKNTLEINLHKQSKTSNDIEILIQYVLLLIRALFQSIKVPYFDPGSILKCSPEKHTKSKYNIRITVVDIDYIPEFCYQIILSFALYIVSWMMKNERTTEKTKILFDIINKEIISKLSGIINSKKSTLPILRTAYEENIPFTHLGAGVYQLGWGSKSRLIDGSTIDTDSSIGVKLSQNKIITSNIIRQAGLPAPINDISFTFKDAKLIAKKITWPVVVKPIDGNRGEGVSIGISNNKDLKIAFEKAKQYSKLKQVIIEREVVGIAHRIFIANNKFLYAVKRLPISIKGNGKQTISELIIESNNKFNMKAPWLRTDYYLPIDKKSIIEIHKAGYSLNSIPKDGEFIPLRNIESTADGGRNEDITHSIHPDNIDIALKAAKLFGLSVIGIDIISADITKSWYKNGAIINEVNYSPLLSYEPYILTYIKQIIEKNGKIPITVIIGGNTAMEYGIKEQKLSIEDGYACFLSNHTMTLSNINNEIIMPFRNLYERCKALLLNNSVESIILVVQTDEFLYSDFPIGSINKIKVIDDDIVKFTNNKEKISKNKFLNLLKKLDALI